eukprot:Rmarinus@m.24374
MWTSVRAGRMTAARTPAATTQSEASRAAGVTKGSQVTVSVAMTWTSVCFTRTPALLDIDASTTRDGTTATWSSTRTTLITRSPQTTSPTSVATAKTILAVCRARTSQRTSSTGSSRTC